MEKDFFQIILSKNTLYVPDNFTGKEKWPLFIGVHPYTSNGAGAQEMWKRFAP